MIVPVLALALPLSAMFERLQSQAMREVIQAPFVRAAVARGVPRARIVWRDALRLGVRPIVSIYGLVVGTLLSGSFAVEIVTAWPGPRPADARRAARARRLPRGRLRGRGVGLPGGRDAPVRRGARASSIRGSPSEGARPQPIILAAAALGARSRARHCAARRRRAVSRASERAADARSRAGRAGAVAASVHLSVGPRQPARTAIRGRSVVARSAPLVQRRAPASARPTPLRAPLLWLGADSYGRDVFSRLLHGARLSLGLALLASLGAMVLGAAVGASPATWAARWTMLLMRASDFVLVLPAMYVALALRSVMPLVLTPGTVLRAAARDLRRRRRAVLLARRARHRPHRARARLRGGGAVARRQPRRACSCGICCRRRAGSSPSS